MRKVKFFWYGINLKVIIVGSISGMGNEIRSSWLKILKFGLLVPKNGWLYQKIDCLSAFLVI